MGSAYGHLGYYEPNTSYDGDENIGLGAGYLMPITDTVYIDTQFTYRHLVNVDEYASSSVAATYQSSDISVNKESGMQIHGSIGVIVVF